MHPISWILLIIGCLESVCGQGDSLRSALNAIDRRQRDLSDYDDTEYGYTLDKPEDLAFLKAAPGYNSERAYEKMDMSNRPLFNYLDDDRYENEDVNKRISSAFRERVEEDNERQLEELAKNIVSNVESKGKIDIDGSGDYEELLRELWEKYRHPYERAKMYSSKIDKRYYYPRFGMDSIGLRRRSNRYDNSDDTYVHQYVPGEENFNNDNDDDQINYLKKRSYQKANKLNKFLRGFSNPYSQIKRYPVTKRSSDYATQDKLNKEHNKRSTIKKQTDPKVEKELSNVFGTKESELTSTKVPVTNQTTPKMEVVENNQQANLTNTEKNQSKAANNKEVLSLVVAVGEKPLQIKKKSIDWSDYFGLDRRKKSEPNDSDKEWFIARYHKSISLSNKKRTAEVPLSSFRNHDDPSKKEITEDTHDEREKLSIEDKKIDDIDSKLKIMEDRIVDDALKYTGAHEGETDSKEIQEVKDKVISRLAAAYSLEKMRNALGEFRLAVAKERERLKNRKPEDDDYIFSDEKRTAVPRKQVLDKDRESVPEGDNDIKCAEGSDDCHEQNYKTPIEIIENHFGIGECPIIQRACDDIASIVGQYGHVFKSACSVYEMCYLCSNNTWFSPTRQCNTLFYAMAFDLCNGHMECQKEAQRFIKYLFDVNRSLRSQPLAVNDCELSCPERDTLLHPIDTR